MATLQPDEAELASRMCEATALNLTIVTLPALGGHPNRETARGAQARVALQTCLEAWAGPLSFGQAVVGPDKELKSSAIVIVASSPTELVAQALQDGVELETALTAWQELRKILLAFLEGRHNKVLLVWDAAVLRDPATVLEEVATRLGLEVATPAPAGTTEPELSPLTARALLQAELGFARRAAEDAPPAALDQHWLTLPEHADGSLRTRVSPQALLAQIAKDEREVAQAEIRALLHDTEEAWLHRETQRIESHATERAAQKSEIDRHLAEILRLSQEVEYYRSLADTLKSTPSVTAAEEERPKGEPERGLDEEVEKLRAEIEAIRRSRSWRLTRPLRSVSRLLRRHPPPQRTPSGAAD